MGDESVKIRMTVTGLQKRHSYNLPPTPLDAPARPEEPKPFYTVTFETDGGFSGGAPYGCEVPFTSKLDAEQFRLGESYIVEFRRA